MKIYLQDQQKNRSALLREFKHSVVLDYDSESCKKKSSKLQFPSNKKWEELDFSFFFNYDIFPVSILKAYGQWEEEKRTMRNGDTILQQVHLPPITGFSLKMLFSVRITELINESNKKSFSYQTVLGHVESGISSFTLEPIGNTEVLFSVETLSRPTSNWNNRLGFLFALPYQQFCTNALLKNVRKKIQNQQ